MSRQLLSNLNGNNMGLLKQFLNEFEGEPRIAWYPSAFNDFRPLLYLNPEDKRFHPAPEKEPQSPDLFLFTDYWAWNSHFLNNRTLFKDENTHIFIEDMEELPKLNLLPLHKEIAHFPEGDEMTDRVVFLKIKIRNSQLGVFLCFVLYAFAENEIFYCKKLVPNNSKISHIVHVCYGGGRSGGSGFGIWLLNVLTQLKCELYIADQSPYEREKYYKQEQWMTGDKYAFQFCGVPKKNEAKLTLIEHFDSEKSLYRCARWYLVE